MTALFVGLALVPAAPALKAPRDEPPPIVGEWRLVEWLQGGQPTAFTDGAGGEFRPDGKRMWWEQPGEVQERGYKLIPKTSPPAVDLIRPSGGGEPDVFPCIYKVDGDTLVLAIGEPGGDRPKTIEEGKDPGKMLMTFKRVPKK